MLAAVAMSWIVFAQEEFNDFEEEFGGGGANGELKPADIGAMIAMIVIYGIIILAVIALWAFVLYTYYTALNSIPQQFRTMEPGHVFFLLIPCFNIVWIFFIVQKIPESFRNYFHAVGDQSRGDCGATIGLWYAILTAVSCIPCVNYITGIPTLVLMIIFLVKVTQLRNVVRQGAAAFAAGGYGGQVGYYGGDPKNPYASPGEFPPKY